jgi:hypothetical protein
LKIIKISKIENNFEQIFFRLAKMGKTLIFVLALVVLAGKFLLEISLS